ncbi:MAG: raffinose/stachyose/melibiose transport system permease protein [Epulopiscium sp.]|jgi:raffinose/stachyose/melibiose transport system permease protein|uniref:ABC transporter permease subunit n=1 Tax=Defluviitalea raffinosedens TaxID=1450156 RepID=A0A7C8HIN0_9FIRM|nr:carbohydrate ABC transporter permease [Defluviitalea raffinosedens]MBZ4668023.1 araQ1 [Defluviitaleaceae bacterium]MDK2787913.1 raffinose/stachyose/melibiose transport system permease protein [Candidatus Epulonipiscium sp.]KAE9635412.1 ABC transporter permease subunit [Defluviitalea raffinosedens]MBM7684315.1 raffinose/stachyose/melibiose transport system permease protein [Defluviitalea raffinosedens]HHW67591.1 carbohydrate ABC transporter permease [Candidatus Epulonipiscium sp.]
MESSVKAKSKDIIIYTILGIWAAINLFPLYWMFTFSLKDNREIFGENVVGLPRKWLWSNYEAALTTGNMGLYFINSIIVTCATIILTTIFSLMASYALNRLVWKGRNLVNSIFMLGLTVPIHAALLPIFIILRNLKMTNSYQALIIPYTAFALAMAIMICGGFIENIPRELEEAACIDGAGIFGIFFRVILPLMKPALSTIAIFTFLQAWNELMFAVIFISDSKYRTLSVGIQTLSGSYTTDWGPIGAALVIATFPTLVAYSFMSKKIQQSLMAGAIKG